MIVTITLNPSVDISYTLDSFERNGVNRCSSYLKTAGGKGINVSRVLAQLGADVLATGFLGGGTGRMIETELKQLLISPHFVWIKGETRNCISILTAGEQTEILEAGPGVTAQEEERLVQELENLFKRQQLRVITASGSLPRGLAPHFYVRLIELAKKHGVKFLLDTSGAPLIEAVKASPYLIKPNVEELEMWHGKKISSEAKLISALRELKKYQIKMIVVSLGAEGCVALCGDTFYRVQIPRVRVKNPVGSGDAMVAGMSYELAKESSAEQVLRVGATCGTLNAMHEKTGFIDLERFDQIYEQVRVKAINETEIL